MKICFVENFSETNPDGWVKDLMDMGHTVTPYMTNDVDVVFNASVVKMDKAFEYKRDYAHIPLVNYCWDYYKWAHEGKHSLNWSKYAELLKMSQLIMVPSSAQKLRLKELLGLDSVVVKTNIAVKDIETSDQRFVLDPVRWYPDDPNCYWAKKASEELGIPFNHSEHKYPLEVFQGVVANCTFMTCAYIEASTGGLSLMEGLWNGKPSLVSDSPYMGAKDYLGEFGFYFKHDDFEDLKRRMDEMYRNPPKIDIASAREYITKNFSTKAMAESINKHLCEPKNNC